MGPKHIHLYITNIVTPLWPNNKIMNPSLNVEAMKRGSCEAKVINESKNDDEQSACLAESM
jgi:hypothetical protein